MQISEKDGASPRPPPTLSSFLPSFLNSHLLCDLLDLQQNLQRLVLGVEELRVIERVVSAVGLAACGIREAGEEELNEITRGLVPYSNV